MITEWDDPQVIAKKLEKASDFLKEKSQELPADTRVVDPAMSFRNRIMDRMGALAGEKVPIIREYLKDYEMKDYEDRKKDAELNEGAYKRTLQREEQALEKEQQDHPKGAGGPYRSAEQPVQSAEERLRARGVEPPEKPVPPPGYEDWKHRGTSEEAAEESVGWLRDLWSKVKGKVKRKAAAITSDDRALLHVLARKMVPSIRQRVALYHEIGASYSSYPPRWTMGQHSASDVRTAVYWGQQPYEQTAPYEGWSQLHARDFGDGDFDALLGAARDWLKLPVLAREIKGLYRDTQVRAALDLAIRDYDKGKYSVGLHPTVYNKLLARLSGQSGPYELLTGKPKDVPEAGVTASKSTYGATTRREVQTMKASAQVRMFASRAAAATKDPELSFDLIAFADHLAGEESQESQEQQAPAQTEQQKQAAIRIAATAANKFNSVKALVVKQATEHPEMREVFLPILQALKA